MMELVLTAEAFHVRPSSFISGIGGYAAYCFDVAGAIYLSNLKEGKKPLVDASTWL